MRFLTSATMRLAALVGIAAMSATAFAATPPVPRPTKELEIVDPAGKHILLSQYKGKVVLIQFLLTTCPHCQAMSEMVTKLQTQYGPQGFQALGAAVNTDEAKLIKEYINDHHVNFPVGAVPYDTATSFLGVNQRLSFPQVIIIDRKGQIQAQSDPEGTENLQTEAYLKTFIGKLLSSFPIGAAKAPATKTTAVTK